MICQVCHIVDRTLRTVEGFSLSKNFASWLNFPALIDVLNIDTNGLIALEELHKQLHSNGLQVTTFHLSLSPPFNYISLLSSSLFLSPSIICLVFLVLSPLQSLSILSRSLSPLQFSLLFSLALSLPFNYLSFSRSR